MRSSVWIRPACGPSESLSRSENCLRYRRVGERFSRRLSQRSFSERHPEARWRRQASTVFEVKCTVDAEEAAVRVARRPGILSKLWIGTWLGQAASSPSSSGSPRSRGTSSTNCTQARTTGRRCARFSRRYYRCAISSSVYAICRPFVHEPVPLVTRCRSRATDLHHSSTCAGSRQLERPGA